MMRVVYLSCIPLTAKVSNDWYIDHLRVSGVELAYWDITPLVRGEVVEHYRQSSEYVREFVDERALEEAVATSRDAVFVLLLPKIWKFRRIFRLLTRYRCKTVAFQWGALPAFSAASRASLLRVFGSPRVLLTKVRNRLHTLLLSSHWYLPQYDLLFAAGRVMLGKSDDARKTVPVALFDYDQFAQAEPGERLVEEKYAVFLDNYMPFHSDHALVGMPPLDPEVYYEKLHRFFSAVERRHGLRVVIAAHPRSRYCKDEFRGREIIPGKTVELTRDADLLLFHASTSVSYAVLGRKPVWAIYTDEMERLYRHNYMQLVRAMADYLGLPLINVSQLLAADLPPIGAPDEARYAGYVRDFLATDGIVGGQSKEIVRREITALAG
jgi:hypothetical protein